MTSLKTPLPSLQRAKRDTRDLRYPGFQTFFLARGRRKFTEGGRCEREKTSGTERFRSILSGNIKLNVINESQRASPSVITWTGT